MHTPDERRGLVAELVRAGVAHSQGDLALALGAQGVEVTQATLSRDLRALGAVKGPDGYRMPDGAGADPLERALRQWLTGATAAQNLVVLRTPPGGASPLGVELDAHVPDGVVGTIAGDDTILVVTPDGARAASLADELMRRAGHVVEGGAA